MRHLRHGQRTQVLIGGPDLPVPQVLAEFDDILLEAPNWTRDGRLLLNGAGRLFALDAASGGSLQEIPFEDLPEINNDHVLHPDGRRILMSAQDGQIHAGELTGGPVQALTSGPGGHYLHGISPDGCTIAYVDVIDGVGRLMLQDLVSGAVREVPVGPGHLDGPGFTPDGRALVLNTEAFTDAAGHAQLARIPFDADGRPGAAERLVASETVDLFPHVAPDGRWATYLAYPAGILGHPEDLPVEVRVVSTDDWSHPVQAYPLHGGQGTLNVASWAPDSERFAFVAYPID